MKRLIVYAAIALAISGCSYGGDDNAGTDSSRLNTDGTTDYNYGSDKPGIQPGDTSLGPGTGTGTSTGTGREIPTPRRDTIR